MIGSPNPEPAVYGDASRRVARLLERVHPGREERLIAAGLSDHSSFQRAGIPVGGYFTGATEPGPGGRPRDPCYHRSCDTLANVDRRVLLGMARASERALRRLAAQAK
jgi:aminopeptidase S